MCLLNHDFTRLGPYDKNVLVSKIFCYSWKRHGWRRDTSNCERFCSFFYYKILKNMHVTCLVVYAKFKHHQGLISFMWVIELIIYLYFQRHWLHPSHWCKNAQSVLKAGNCSEPFIGFLKFWFRRIEEFCFLNYTGMIVHGLLT